MIALIGIGIIAGWRVHVRNYRRELQAQRDRALLNEWYASGGHLAR